MVAFVLQRVCRRRPICRSILPGTRPASQLSPLAAERWRRADETRIETLTAKWQPHWDSLDATWDQLRENDKGKAYVLPMFPYPSGTLHLGHLRVYTISDVLARFKHMQGYNVLHPIGWDAFGLPAENAAIERGVHPEKWTLQNIGAMKSQMKDMGGRWNWDAEIRTCDPHFYQHTQRIFLMLHERGLAYQAKSLVNYDPVDKTVLANEQVDANGRSWRSGAKVEKVMLKQWFLKIKEYQDPLLNDLEALAENGRWPEKVLAMQKNWIGKSEGTKLWFDIESKNALSEFDSVYVFTTRADTLFGVQYIALSLNHPIVRQSALADASLRSFIERAPTLPPDTKEGYLLPDVVARNPIAENIDGVEPEIPVYVAPYVLDDYGSGAVMGVPGHDTRDHAFWRANAGERPIKVVITSEPGVIPEPLVPGEHDKPITERGYVAANIERYEGLPSRDVVQDIVDELQSLGKRAEVTSNWRLRDWLISRQRYWGTPIPIIHCSSCGPVPVPEAHLPVKLPSLPDSFFDGKKGNPLAEDEYWKKTKCPKCGSAAERETDTMDTFMDSSWYFFRFLDPKNETALVDPEKANKGMPVDLYVGGVEHAILHLLYARFISKFLASTSTWPEGKLVAGEPFQQLITQGMVHGKTYTDPETGRFLRPDELDMRVGSAPSIKANGLNPIISYEKMSKSKYNGVDPGKTIAMHGPDATRAHMLFQAPVGEVLEWDLEKITGVKRWLHRVVKLSSAWFVRDDELASFELPGHQDLTLPQILRALLDKGILSVSHEASRDESARDSTIEQLLYTLWPEERKLWIQTQHTIASVTESYSQTYSLNTIVSDLMALTKTIADCSHGSASMPYLRWYSTAHLIRMLAPIAPGVAEEAWHLLTGVCKPKDQTVVDTTQRPFVNYPTVFAAGFPTADLGVCTHLAQTFKCVVQVDGKRKFEVELQKDSSSKSLYPKSFTRFILDRLLQTEPGREWLSMGAGKIWKLSRSKEPHPQYKVVPDDWNVIVVNDGKLVNLVGPKAGKPKKKKKDGQSITEEPRTQVVSQESSGRQVTLGLNNSSSSNERSEPHITDGDQTTTQESRPSSPSTLPLQEIHTRVDSLMSTLPRNLRPKYIPSTLLPIRRQAIELALINTQRLSLPRIKHDTHPYQHLYSSTWPTPPTIAPEHILDIPASGLSGTREDIARRHNGVFPEQLGITCHPLPERPRKGGIIPNAQRSVLYGKLYRQLDFANRRARKHNAQLTMIKGAAKGVERGKGELGVALGMRDDHDEILGAKEETCMKIHDKTDVEAEYQRVEKVWESIMNLWAMGFDIPEFGMSAPESAAVRKVDTKWTFRKTYLNVE